MGKSCDASLASARRWKLVHVLIAIGPRWVALWETPSPAALEEVLPSGFPCPSVVGPGTDRC